MKAQQEAVTESTIDSQELNEIETLPSRCDRQTDGIVFGSALIVVILMAGVIANLRNG